MSSTSFWGYSPIEEIARERVHGLHDGANIWARYEVTRQDIGSNILPYIASQEPGLSDHGTAHIANVMENVGRILGLKANGKIEDGSKLQTVTAPELLLLLLGSLLHDIGNISGRDGHNQVTERTWRDSGKESYKLWGNPDRKSVIALCQAHTGKAPDGTKDTLKPLNASSYYFLGDQIEIGRLAAILRFADELAEGQQRTSRYLLFQNKYDPDKNEVYHRYANCTTLLIDRAGGRVALYFQVDVNEFKDEKARVKQIRDLIDLIFKRIVKLDNERVFARAYAGDWIPFAETSIVLEVVSEGEKLVELPPITLNDFNTRSAEAFALKAIDSAYDVDDVVSRVESSFGATANE